MSMCEKCQQRLNTAEKARARQADMREAGLAYGPTPYGFDRVGEKLVPNPDEQMLIKLMHAQREKGMTYSEIAEWFNGKQVATKRGGEKWTPAAIRKIILRTTEGT